MARTPKVRPWFRKSRGAWYVTIQGRQILLEGATDQKSADAAVETLVDRLAAGIAAKLVLPSAVQNASARQNVLPSAVHLLHVGSEQTAPITGPTVSQSTLAFLHAAQKRVLTDNLSGGTLEKYSRLLGWFAEAFGSRLLTSLQAEEIEAWGSGFSWSNSTANYHLAIVQRLFNSSGVRITIRRPPMESRGAEVVLTDDQFARVLVSLRKCPIVQADLPELLQVLRESGARPQEIAKLKVNHVDWENCHARLRKHKTARKTGEDRIIHFNKAAMAILKMLRERYGAGYLFRTRYGNSYSASCLVKRLAWASEQVGFRVIAYSLRHTFATRALEVGVPDAVVAALLGQKGTTMVNKHYGHVAANSRLLKDAAERASTQGQRKTG